MLSASLIDIIGWIGSASVVIAYALLSNNKLVSSSLTYQLLNLLGGICLVINTFYHAAYPSTLVNVVWAVIAISTLARVVHAPSREVAVNSPSKRIKNKPPQPQPAVKD